MRTTPTGRLRHAWKHGCETDARELRKVPDMAVPSDDRRRSSPQYAHPERLVSTDWLAEQIADGRVGRPDGVVVVESDEDVLLYDTGHIPGAVKVDWHTDLNDPVTRDYVDGERVRRRCMGRNGHRPRHDRRHLRRQEQLVGGLRPLGVHACSATRTSGCSTAAAPSGSPRAAS